MVRQNIKKDENDDINYNDTVFAKMIQNYGGAQQIVKFMQMNKKLFKRAKKNPKIVVYPPIYVELYEYVIGRFMKRYNKEKVGKVLVGGKLANADFTKLFNDVKSMDLFSEVSANHLDEEADRESKPFWVTHGTKWADSRTLDLRFG